MIVTPLVWALSVQEPPLTMHSRQPSMEVGREISYCADREVDVAYAVTPSVRVEFLSISVDGQPVSHDEIMMMNRYLSMFGWLNGIFVRCQEDNFFLTANGSMTQVYLDLYSSGNSDGIDDTYTLHFTLTDNRLTREPDTPIRPARH